MSKIAMRPAEAKRQVMKSKLPDHFHVTDGELSVISRLVRVIRKRNYRGALWLGPFIEWLLYLETTSPHRGYAEYVHTSEAISDAIEDMGGKDGFIDSLAFVKAARRKCPGLTFVSEISVPGRPIEDRDLLLPDEEDQFFEIVRLWRLEHPEPPKRSQFPKHQAKHQSNKDSDGEGLPI